MANTLSGRLILPVLKMQTNQKQTEDLKNDFLLVLLPSKTKKKIRELARTEERSLSSFCLNAINLYLKNKSEADS